MKNKYVSLLIIGVGVLGVLAYGDLKEKIDDLTVDEPARETDTDIRISNDATCTEGKTRCHAETVQKCLNNVWKDWTDCLTPYEDCLIREGEALCVSSSDKDTDSDTDTDTGMKPDTNMDTTCADNPCDVNATCNATGQLIECTCNAGWKGDGYVCEDIDDCDPDPCINGNCKDGVDSYTCACEAGWEGVNCDIDIDNCYSDPCVNGSCINEIDSYTCTCEAGWEGAHCDRSIDDCDPDPCINGSCTDEIDGYTCTCKTGWEGAICDIDIDDCAPNPCVHGRCTDGLDSYTCTCKTGWVGANCDRLLYWQYQRLPVPVPRRRPYRRGR